MMCCLLRLKRCEQKQHWSLLGEAWRIHGWFICSLSWPQWKQKLRCCFYQPGPLSEQNTYCITQVGWARDKLVLLSHKDSGSLFLQLKLLSPDRSTDPGHMTSWQPPVSDSVSLLAFRLVLCWVQLLGTYGALKYQYKAVPGLWIKTETHCCRAHSDPAKL